MSKTSTLISSPNAMNHIRLHQLTIQLWDADFNIYKLTDKPTENKGNYLMWRQYLLLKKALTGALSFDGATNRNGDYHAHRQRILEKKLLSKSGMRKSASHDGLTLTLSNTNLSVIPDWAPTHRRRPSGGAPNLTVMDSSNSSFHPGHRRTHSSSAAYNLPPPNALTPNRYEFSYSHETGIGLGRPESAPTTPDRRSRIAARGRGRGRGRGINRRLSEPPTPDPSITQMGPSIVVTPSQVSEALEAVASGTGKNSELRTVSSMPDLQVFAKEFADDTHEKPVAPRPTTSEPKRDLLKINKLYEFAGMHHIFAEHISPVTKVLFANNDKNLLACSSIDGTISICSSLQSPRLLRKLEGHSEAITSFAWSGNNEYIVSVSMDMNIRIWTVRNGDCIVTFPDKSFIYCVSFHPTNNNLVFIGTEKGLIKVLNINTGKFMEKVKVGGPVTSLVFTPQGNTLFAGDKKGAVYTFIFNKDGTMKLIAKCQVSKGSVNSLSFKPANGKQPPFLLTNTTDSSLRLFKVDSKVVNGNNLTLFKSMPVPNTREAVKSKFCPVLTEDVLVVSGSEDSTVYIYDVMREVPLAINKLQGHSGVVYDVCWNCDESVLASCDSVGMVILWKRTKQVVNENNNNQ